MNKFLLIVTCLLGVAIIILTHPPKPPLFPQQIVPKEPPIAIPKPEPPKEPTTAELLLMAHNKIRDSYNKPLLEEDETLSEFAQKWAEHMAKTSMYHQSLSPLLSQGWRAAAENIAMGQDDVDEVIRAWMNSRGHKNNILGNYTHIGIGVAKSKNGRLFWCVDFGRMETKILAYHDSLLLF